MNRIPIVVGSLMTCALAVIPFFPGVAAAQSSPAQGAEQLRNAPAVHAGLFRLRADGTVGGFSGDRVDKAGDDLGGVVYFAPCSTMGASAPHVPVRALATEVWRLSGRVLTLAEDQATVELTWQRIRRGGKDETNPAQSRTITVNKGERVRLEASTIPANGTCGEQLMALEVAFGMRDEIFSLPPRPTAAAEAGRARGTARVFAGGGGGYSAGRVVAAGEPAPTMPMADLWLVHASAEGTDETRHTTLPAGAGAFQFTFAPLLIRASTGTVTVTVQGSLEFGMTADGKEQLYFSANRTATFAPSNRPMRDVTFGVDGSTKVMLPRPGPDEVLSFELPPLTIPGGSMLPDRLSIRVRLSSRPMRELPGR